LLIQVVKRADIHSFGLFLLPRPDPLVEPVANEGDVLPHRHRHDALAILQYMIESRHSFTATKKQRSNTGARANNTLHN